jgi:hypothetical protein
MRNLGIDAHHLAVLQGGDEAECVPDGRQEDVATGLVRLGLEGEAQVITLVLDVAAEEVQRLGESRERIS